jgi:hypothetical protein
MNKRAKLFIVTTMVYFGQGVPNSWATTVGAYCGKDTSFSVEQTRGFIDQTGFSQWYYANRYMFSDYNNSYIDAVNFAVFSGHGGAFAINTLTDDWIGFDGVEGNDPKYPAGDTSNGGWGERSLRHIVFSSCAVVPSPIERGDWWRWRDACHVWTGVRHILGYRTDVYIDSATAILREYANLMVNNNEYVMSAWFDAINLHANHDGNSDYGAIVYHPSTFYDRFTDSVARAPDQNLSVWYQY